MGPNLAIAGSLPKRTLRVSGVRAVGNGSLVEGKASVSQSGGVGDTARSVRPAERPSVRGAGVLLGIGFGGFVDGIVLHQILQWHHMLTATGDYPATTVAGLEDNTLADGLFHALTFVASLAGLWLLWAALRKGAVLAGRHLAGLMLAGWGVFNLVEGIIDHQILTVHHVNTDNVVLWDSLFLAFGAMLLLSGIALVRSSPQAEDTSSGA